MSIGKLPCKTIDKLAELFDPSGILSWRTLAANLPPEPYVYSASEISRIEEQGNKLGGSPTRCLLQNLECRGFDVEDLQKALTKMEHQQALEIVQEGINQVNTWPSCKNNPLEPVHKQRKEGTSQQTPTQRKPVKWILKQGETLNGGVRLQDEEQAGTSDTNFPLKNLPCKTTEQLVHIFDPPGPLSWREVMANLPPKHVYRMWEADFIEKQGNKPGGSSMRWLLNDMDKRGFDVEDLKEAMRKIQHVKALDVIEKVVLGIEEMKAYRQSWREEEPHRKPTQSEPENAIQKRDETLKGGDRLPDVQQAGARDTLSSSTLLHSLLGVIGKMLYLYLTSS